MLKLCSHLGTQFVLIPLAFNPIPSFSAPCFFSAAAAPRLSRLRLRARVHPSSLLLGPGDRTPKPSPLSDSLKILEWDKLCDAVASFAGTALGRDATKVSPFLLPYFALFGSWMILWSSQAKLLSVDVSFEGSKRLLEETAAAVELINYSASGLDFAVVDTVLVKSAITRVSRGSLLNGSEAMAVVSLIQFAQTLQVTLQSAVKQDAVRYNRFMPISEMIMDVIISQSFVKSAQLVINEDGSVKDSASSELRRSRDQVRMIEQKLNQLIDKLISRKKNETSNMEVCIINGRCCIKATTDRLATFDGLLLSSGSSSGGLVEPIAAIPLNDELQQARGLVIKAEEDVLSRLTDKLLAEIDDIQNLLQTIIRLDVITARAKYSLAYDGTFPDIYLPSHMGEEPLKVPSQGVTTSSALFHVSRRNWKLYMLKSYHPLLLKRHRESLHKFKKDVADATAVSELQKSHPIPVDFMVSENTGVLVITGSNTGGKTISLKTVGLASLMAKTGLYVLASEPVKIPWFDGIFADIGDEQSLTQSLSTFSGHLRQIGAIRSQSTSYSLILLDEVGAGTNPLEGAALGMSILESFAEAKSFLTIATTHHGELKTLKYSNGAFENACVEFDEVSLKPTYRILWGVPGRSNAINIAERLGLAHVIVDGARELLGTASVEINEVIVDMERFKQAFRENLQEAVHYLMLSKELRKSLLMAKKNVADHAVKLKHRKMKAVSDSAAVARSLLRSKLQQLRESSKLKSDIKITVTSSHSAESLEDSESHNRSLGRSISSETSKLAAESHNSSLGRTTSSETSKPAACDDDQSKIPLVGETVHVPSLGKQAIVVKVEEWKGEIIVQAGIMKLRLKLKDIGSQRTRMF